MKTEFLKHFYKDLDSITLVSVRNNVADIILNVEKASGISDIRNIKKLSGHRFAYRIKSGDYRIGVFIENNIVEFVRLAHRKDIYKVFP
ncbi:MAG: type II toxin-antitoxin system RelE/ParE family toxin [Bacteroidia bacterium]|nr:type II toxin-antitoxin system RelE/ParE family toxin [Bacteroidia bacterium]